MTSHVGTVFSVFHHPSVEGNTCIGTGMMDDDSVVVNLLGTTLDVFMPSLSSTIPPSDSVSSFLQFQFDKNQSRIGTLIICVQLPVEGQCGEESHLPLS